MYEPFQSTVVHRHQQPVVDLSRLLSNEHVVTVPESSSCAMVAFARGREVFFKART